MTDPSSRFFDPTASFYSLQATFGVAVSATEAFRGAAASYLEASAFIRTRPTNVVRLFNYDPEMSDAEARFRQTLQEIEQSLSDTVTLSYVTNQSVTSLSC